MYELIPGLLPRAPPPLPGGRSWNQLPSHIEFALLMDIYQKEVYLKRNS